MRVRTPLGKPRVCAPASGNAIRKTVVAEPSPGAPLNQPLYGSILGKLPYPPIRLGGQEDVDAELLGSALAVSFGASSGARSLVVVSSTILPRYHIGRKMSTFAIMPSL